jgi:hypothetical protein
MHEAAVLHGFELPPHEAPAQAALVTTPEEEQRIAA